MGGEAAFVWTLHSPSDIGNIVDIYTSESGVAAILSNGNVAIWGAIAKISNQIAILLVSRHYV